MLSTNKETFYVMDVIKFVLCLCVIAIHTGVVDLFQYGNLITKCVFRLAVPYFMISSGFLLGMKVRKCNIESLKSIIIKFVKRLLLMLLIFEPISLLLNAASYIYAGESYQYVVIKTFQSILFYPPGALWYIQALLIGIFLLYPRIKRTVEYHQNGINPYYKAFWGGALIGIPLYCIALLSNSYYFVIEGTSFQKIIALYLKIAKSARNGVFYGYFMLSLGFLGAEAHVDEYLEKRKLTVGRIAIAGMMLYGLYILEIMILDGKAFADDGALFVFQVPFVLWLMVVSVQKKKISSKTIIFRNLSTGMYLLHSPLKNVVWATFKVCRTDILPIPLFLIVTILSLMICLVCYRGNWRISRILK